MHRERRTRARNARREGMEAREEERAVNTHTQTHTHATIHELKERYYVFRALWQTYAHLRVCFCAPATPLQQHPYPLLLFQPRMRVCLCVYVCLCVSVFTHQDARGLLAQRDRRLQTHPASKTVAKKGEGEAEEGGGKRQGQG